MLFHHILFIMIKFGNLTETAWSYLPGNGMLTGRI